MALLGEQVIRNPRSFVETPGTVARSNVKDLDTSLTILESNTFNYCRPTCRYVLQVAPTVAPGA